MSVVAIAQGSAQRRVSGRRHLRRGCSAVDEAPDAGEDVLDLEAEVGAGHDVEGRLHRLEAVEVAGASLGERRFPLAGVEQPQRPVDGQPDLVELIDGFEDEMRAAGADWQFVQFSKSVHCFAEPDEHGALPGCVFNPVAYRRSVRMMNGFFREAFAKR